MAATNPKSLKTVTATGLVPVKFLGVPKDANDPDGDRVGEAGLGLRVGEIRGVEPITAARMIDMGTAELVPIPAERVAAPAKPAA